MKLGTDLQLNKLGLFEKLKELGPFWNFKKFGLLLKKKEKEKTDCLKTGLKCNF